MSNKMIIEARVNEYAMRDENPHVPWTAAEIAETAARCRDEGASILHFHARQPDGLPAHSVEAYAEIIRSVRAKCDILIHPTLGFFSNDEDPQSRISCVVELARDPETKPDMVPIDIGSTNLDTYDAATQEFAHADRVYTNRTDTLQHYARELDAAGVKPVLVSWSVGFTRRAEALIEMGLIGEPAFFLLNMTDGPYLTGHPGTPDGLDAHLRFLPRGRRIEWASNVVGGDLLSLCEMTAKLGGHIAPGIGDYAYKELGYPTNEDVVRRAVQIARDAGRDIASPDEAREILGF